MSYETIITLGFAALAIAIPILWPQQRTIGIILFVLGVLLIFCAIFRRSTSKLRRYKKLMDVQISQADQALLQGEKDFDFPKWYVESSCAVRVTLGTTAEMKFQNAANFATGTFFEIGYIYIDTLKRMRNDVREADILDFAESDIKECKRKKSLSSQVDLMEARLDQKTPAKEFKDFINKKKAQVDSLIIKSSSCHKHDIEATRKWHEDVCRAVRTALGSEEEIKFRRFLGLQRLISIGTINSGCVACKALQDARHVLVDIHNRVTSADLIQSFNPKDLAEYEG